MRIVLKPDLLILIPEHDCDVADLATWKVRHAGDVFLLRDDGGKGASFFAVGAQAEACREPINVHNASSDPQIALISNFAPTPLSLDGNRYACVEAFWQSLRFPVEERPRIAAMDGSAAKQASKDRPYGTHVHYNGRDIPVGTFGHWQLMRHACRAKFEQNPQARSALLATGNRPLVHRVRRDSRTIPGVVMAEIWMSLRAKLRRSD